MSRQVPRAAALAAVLSLALAACGETTTPSPSVQASEPDQPSTAPAASAEPSVAANPYQNAWMDVTAEAIGETGDWSNKVELADVNADGLVDLLFANGGDYDVPGITAFTDLGPRELKGLDGARHPNAMA